LERVELAEYMEGRRQLVGECLLLLEQTQVLLLGRQTEGLVEPEQQLPELPELPEHIKEILEDLPALQPTQMEEADQ
jgi:hypothetical protein